MPMNIAGDHVIASAANPVQAMAQAMADHLVTPQIRLTIFPADQLGDLCEPFGERRRRIEPVAGR